MKAALDDHDVRIIALLQVDGRASISELARQIGLSPPSVAERLRKLEADGVIKGFAIDLDPRALGFSLQAIVRVRPLPGQMHIVQRMIDDMPEIIECDKVTGEDCFICRLCLRTIDELDGLLDRLAEKAETNTAIVKSTPVPRRLPPLVLPER